MFSDVTNLLMKVDNSFQCFSPGQSAFDDTFNEAGGTRDFHFSLENFVLLCSQMVLERVLMNTEVCDGEPRGRDVWLISLML